MTASRPKKAKKAPKPKAEIIGGRMPLTVMAQNDTRRGLRDARHFGPWNAVRPGRRSETCYQLQLNWAATRSLSFGVERDRYMAAPALRQAGARDSNYASVQMTWGW